LKHSRASTVLIVIGALLVMIAPVWAWGIAPLFIKLPKDLEVITDYKGRLTLYADSATRRFYPPGQEKVVPLAIYAEDRSVPSRGNGKVLVVDENVNVTDSSTGQPMVGVRPAATYVLDRRTSENVPGYLPGVERSGWSLTFPLGARKKGYPLWDDELNRTNGAFFVREQKMDGDKYKGVTVYVYKSPGSMEKMVKPPPGLPETLTGKQLKEMAGQSDLPIADNASMQMSYYKKQTATQYVEPRTGMVAYVPDLSYEYYAKNGPGMSPDYIKLARVEYGGTKASARQTLDSAAKYFWLIDLDLVWTPVSYLVGGLVLLGIGIVLRVRSRRKPTDEPA
jgi:hypothetical protein